jgi:hypothetical protein
VQPLRSSGEILLFAEAWLALYVHAFADEAAISAFVVPGY